MQVPLIAEPGLTVHDQHATVAEFPRSTWYLGRFLRSGFLPDSMDNKDNKDMLLVQPGLGDCRRDGVSQQGHFGRLFRGWCVWFCRTLLPMQLVRCIVHSWINSRRHGACSFSDQAHVVEAGFRPST